MSRKNHVLKKRNARYALFPLSNEAPEPLAKRSDIEIALRRLAPGMPAHEFSAAVDHALDSRGLRHAKSEEAAWLSLVSYVRHQFTDYDELLAQSYDEESARFFVAAEIEATLAQWGVRRPLNT